ncbi:hypothetical protein CONLIGDRAFT_701334 [Coniochaeta ligniaria NRRL 30616]|uniref:ABC transporter domain-containing protein n=1 Tax=Coniochaeta ligniaria NRRL 30616 TaxID=1408157 RepID=A0A1J7I3H9_9PEZI|nr:hypothetical protein CONLIGDRAFT_701334 [Coniochaeta ligniaria NRRL 30616]
MDQKASRKPMVQQSRFLPRRPLADLRFPGTLVWLDHVTYSYTTKHGPLLRDINLGIHTASYIGIIGLEGRGKSTPIKLICDGIRPTNGIDTLDPLLKLGCCSQLAVENLRAAGRADPSKTELSTLATQAGDVIDEGHMRGHLALFQHCGLLCTRRQSVWWSASMVRLAKLSYVALAMLGSAASLLTDFSKVHIALAYIVGNTLFLFGAERGAMELNDTVLVGSYNPFFTKSVIEGNAQLLGLEDSGSHSSDDEERQVTLLSLYLLRNRAASEIL